MTDCIFCKIIKKEIPSEIIYEDDYVIAFNDINPVSKTHILVLPKIHLKSINDIDETNEKYFIKIHVAVKNIAEKLNLNDAGYRLISNCGKGAGQTVFHLHYHLISGDNIGVKIV